MSQSSKDLLVNKHNKSDDTIVTKVTRELKVYAGEISFVGTVETSMDFKRFRALYGTDISAKVTLIASNGQEYEMNVFSIDEPEWYED